MRKLLIGLLALVSISAFAQSKSDFEKGYDAGVKSCGNSEAWICKVNSNYAGTSDPYLGRGTSKAQALLNTLENYGSDDRIYIEQFINAGMYKCTKY